MEELKQYIKKRYGKLAKAKKSCSCCGSSSVIEQAKSIGYSDDELKSIPESAVMGLGCGNPTALAELTKGEVVLDLGSGAGIDVFLAANKVGKTGRVIGIDMTKEMVKKGRAIAKKNNYKNVDFKLGEIEALPVKDSSVDLIISNCVINLSSNKRKVFQEAYRVLKSGGRMLISDIVTEEKLPEEVIKSVEAWASCIAGALVKKNYLEEIKRAGFKRVEIISETAYHEDALNEKLKEKIKSIKLKATK